MCTRQSVAAWLSIKLDRTDSWQSKQDRLFLLLVSIEMGTTEDLSRTCAKCFAPIGGGRAMKAKDKLYHADSW